MAVPILRLNIDDNPRIIVKQDSIPVTITGYTQTIVQGSGATTVTESGVNPKIYTVYTPIGSAQWGSILGDVTTQTDLTDYVTQSISAATSGLTSSWNEITDKPQWLDYDVKEEFQTGHTHSYNNLDDLPSLFSGDYDDLTNKPDLSIYLTGYTVTADDVTGITASLYAPIIHTHPYSGLTGLPSLFSGDYDDLTNKPDLSVYQPVSGMSAYLTGVTWNDVTNKPDLTLQSDFTGHTSDLTIHFVQSGISITESQISDLQAYTLTGATQALSDAFDTYTGTTAPASFLPITGLTGYWTSGQTVDYVTGYTPTLEWGNITGSISGQTDLYDALNQKVDYPIYHDDLQTLGGIVDDNYNTLSPITLYSITGITSAGTGQTVIDATTVHAVVLKSFLGSGLVTLSDTGNEIRITVPEIEWGGIIGTLSNQTDLDNILDYKVDWVLYQDDLQVLGNEIDGKSNSGHTHTSLTGLTITESQVTNLVTDLSNKASLYPTIIDVTGTTYTIQETDAGKVLEFSNTGATTCLFPTGLTTGLFVEIYNLGGQQITFSGDTGSTVNASDGNLVLSTEYGYAKARYRGNNKWIIYGWMTA